MGRTQVNAADLGGTIALAAAVVFVAVWLVRDNLVSTWDEVSRAVAGMTSLRRKFIIVTLSLGAFWAVFVLCSHPYHYANQNIVFAFGPPVILFLAGQIFVWAWQLFVWACDGMRRSTG